MVPATFNFFRPKDEGGPLRLAPSQDVISRVIQVPVEKVRVDGQKVQFDLACCVFGGPCFLNMITLLMGHGVLGMCLLLFFLNLIYRVLGKGAALCNARLKQAASIKAAFCTRPAAEGCVCSPSLKEDLRAPISHLDMYHYAAARKSRSTVLCSSVWCLGLTGLERKRSG